MQEVMNLSQAETVVPEFSESLVELWIKFTDVRPSSQKTYVKALKQMFKYFYSNAVTNPTRADIERWKAEMLASKKASTVQLYIIFSASDKILTSIYQFFRL